MFSWVFLSFLLPISSSRIRHSSSPPPNPHPRLSVILYNQASAETKLEAQLLQLKTLYVLMSELRTCVKKGAASKLKKTGTVKSCLPDTALCDASAATLKCWCAPCNYIFDSFFTPLLIYDITHCLFFATEEGLFVFLYFSTWNESVLRKERTMNSPQVRMAHRY